jgi:hypothetical protein
LGSESAGLEDDFPSFVTLDGYNHYLVERAAG